MLSIYNIFTVARYEMKTLLRSWFFRIFAGLIIFILFWLDFAFLTIGDVPWNLRGIASSVPYMNILLLNAAQAVIAVFLASDFLKRDKKLDTTEVIYMRSMTNGDYVMGKTLGIMTVFIGLNLLVLLIGLIFNIISSDVPVRPLAYVYYPLLISIPTLVFILGLAFLFMALIGNQAVTFVVLLGYIATTIFFLGHKMHHLFDYMAFYVPMMRSDFVGIGNIEEIILQRGIYFILGIGGIFATIALLKRLPQSLTMHNLSKVIAVICLAAGIIMGGIFILGGEKYHSERETLIDLNNKNIDVTRPSPLDYTIHLSHKGDNIAVEVSLVLENRNDEPLSTYIFNLNPGLAIKEITMGNKPVQFERDKHLIMIHPDQPLKPGERDSLMFKYAGTIDEDFCFLDTPKEMEEKPYRIWMYNIDKRHAFITPSFVLLTPETGWYPRPGVTYSSQHPQRYIRDFSSYSLTVSTQQGMVPVSQGERIESGSNITFKSNQPLPQISLSIGRYNEASLSVDSLEYSVYTLKGHNYYKPYFDAIADTLPAVLKELTQDFENKIELVYPYKRFSIVEVPIQFISYSRVWTTAGETVQPQIVYLSENGVGVNGADFKGFQRGMERWSRRSNQVTTPAENQTKMFQRFVTSTFLEAQGGMFFRRGGDDEQPSLSNSYIIYPNFYTYVNYIKSDKWPLLNAAMESYIAGRMEDPMQQMRRTFTGLTDEEKVNLALAGKSMKEILQDEDYRDLWAVLIKAKGNYLFTRLLSSMGKDEFKRFLDGLLQDYKYKTITEDDLLQRLTAERIKGFSDEILQWEEGKQLPGFLFSGLEGYSVLDGRRTRYQVVFTVTNPEPVDGILKVQFRLGGRGMGPGRGGPMGGGDEQPERVIYLIAGQTKQIGVVLDAQPRVMTINTMISRNLPMVETKMFEEFKLKDKVDIFDGEKVLDKAPPLTEEGVIIVDNEDSGFSIPREKETSPLRRLLKLNNKTEEEYSGISFWRPPTNWTATTNSSFYGNFVKSAYYIRVGDGSKKVTWKAAISKQGYYDIYCYYANMRIGFRRGKDSGGDRGQYHYIIKNADGEEEALLEKQTAEEGWNFLGTYFLESDTAQVVLTNESEGGRRDLLFADAIKWVKHE